MIRYPSTSKIGRGVISKEVLEVTPEEVIVSTVVTTTTAASVTGPVKGGGKVLGKGGLPGPVFAGFGGNSSKGPSSFEPGPPKVGG